MRATHESNNLHTCALDSTHMCVAACVERSGIVRSAHNCSYLCLPSINMLTANKPRVSASAPKAHQALTHCQAGVSGYLDHFVCLRTHDVFARVTAQIKTVLGCDMLGLCSRYIHAIHACIAACIAILHSCLFVFIRSSNPIPAKLVFN